MIRLARLRRIGSRSLFAGTCLAAVVAGAIGSAAQVRSTASLTATLTLEDLDRRVISSVQHDEPFRLRVDLTDVATNLPPRGLKISGWIRRVDPLNRSCEEEAQAFRVTRVITEGHIDLNGIVVAVLNEDASFGVVDPKLNGQPANMLEAATLGRMPDDFAVDRAGMRALFSFEKEGVVEEVSLSDATRRVIARDLHGPSGAIATPSGVIWIAEGATGVVSRLAEDGTRSASIRIGGGPLSLSSAKPGTSLIGAVSGDGGVALIDGATSRLAFQGRTAGPIAEAVFIGDEGLLTLASRGKQAELRYFDDFERSTAIPLGFAATRLAVAPGGRTVIAFAPGSATVSVIDGATAHVVQAFALNDATISEVAFTERAAFFATREGESLGVLDLAAVKMGSGAAIRRVPLAHKSGPASADRRLLASMLPSPQMLAVGRDDVVSKGWIIPEVAPVDNVPPSDAVLLRGGAPLRVQVVDRSFREAGSGRFETVARIHGGGEHELVLTTGIGGMTTCIRFDVEGAAVAAGTHVFRVSVENGSGVPRARVQNELEFILRDEDGHRLDVETARFLIPSLVSSWSTEVVARRDAGGRLKATVRFPHPGMYVVQPIGVPAGWRLKSAPLIEVAS